MAKSKKKRKPNSPKRRTQDRVAMRKKKEEEKKRMISTLKEKLDGIYNSVDLSTVCCRQCVCCNVACPQMNYSEFLSILDKIYKTVPHSKKVEILKNCVRYYLSNSMVKPCPLLVGKECIAYEERPMSCRVYGLWPKEAYERRVERFAKVSGLEKDKIPLNTQCPNVRRANTDEPLTKEEIDDLFMQLDILDGIIGDFKPEAIEKKHNYRTFHDWFMVKVFGEQRLSDLSNYFLAVEEEKDLEDFVDQMCTQIDKVGEKFFVEE